MSTIKINVGADMRIYTFDDAAEAIELRDALLERYPLPDPFAPDWSRAPEWAHFVATDSDGETCWYSAEPVIHDESESWNYPDQGCRSELTFPACPNWRDSLRKRPEVKEEDNATD